MFSLLVSTGNYGDELSCKEPDDFLQNPIRFEIISFFSLSSPIKYSISSFNSDITSLLLCSYFLIRFAQTKITLFIFWNNWVIKESKSFLLVEPSSRVTCCVEIKLQYFFRKYIFICTIYALLIQLISAILCDTCQAMVAATHGKNLWPPVPNGAMVSDSFTLGRPRAVDNMVSMFWGWHFYSSVCVCWVINRNYATKLYTM